MLKINVLHHVPKGSAGVKAKLYNSSENINIKFKVFSFSSLVR